MDQQTLDEFTEEQASDDSEVRCPTCGRTDFQSKRGIKTHHAKTHGQKLVLVSEDELIDAMRALGEGAPTREEMRTDGKYAPKKYKHKFGSWNEALEAAGYEPRTQHQPITQSELLRSLETLADELGRSPSQLDINEHSKHSAKTYYRKFDGGLEEAKRRVGLEHYEQQSKDRVTVYCAHCDTEIEKTPSELAVSEYHYCSQNCLNEHKKERYSGPDSPIPNTLKPVDCEACGSSIYKAKWEREKKERHYCSDCWGNSKVPIECEQCGEMELVWPAVADKRRFCSPDCKDEWQGEEIRGENHPRSLVVRSGSRDRLLTHSGQHEATESVG
jgi:endogenous inhibitor of DNA gyrase (YacG/DUF329 family)